MVGRKTLLLTALLLCAGMGLGLALSPTVSGVLNAQTPRSLSDERQREQLYAELDREVALLEQQGNVLKKVVRLSEPFVVHIDAKKSDQLSRRNRLVEEAGSGIIIEHRGGFYILTNRHVVKDAELKQITIRLDDGRELHPSRVVADPDTDIAVMAVTATDLISARLGDSDQLEIGDFVLAVGSPFGLSRSVTFGILSAKGRRDLELGGDEVRYQDFLQTDAAINPGNSGGPLLNLRGEVVGMNTAIASSSGGNEGIGFSIPMNMVRVIARQLIETGRVTRAFLGVNLDAKFGPADAARLGLRRPIGARITGITPGSPAEDAGFRVGDVVIEFNGVTVEDDGHLVNIVSLTPVGREVTAVVLRNGRRRSMQVTVGNRRDFDRQSGIDPRDYRRPLQLGLGNSDLWTLEDLGVSVLEVVPEIARHLGVADEQQGMVVAEVDREGPAAGRLQPGDIIFQINRQAVRDADEFQRVLSATDLSREVSIGVIPVAGDAASQTVVLRPAPGRYR